MEREKKEATEVNFSKLYEMIILSVFNTKFLKKYRKFYYSIAGKLFLYSITNSFLASLLQNV